MEEPKWFATLMLSDILISVVMGAYYHRKTVDLLKRSVQSILKQTYDNFEFIICDDGSSQEAVEYLEYCAQQDTRIRLIRGLNRTDLATKLNACISASRGEFIARMDDDDYSYPERLSVQIKYLQSHPEVSFVGCWVRLIQDGYPIGIRKMPEKPTVEDFLFTQPFVHPTLIFRKEVLEDIGGYSEKKYCEGCEDYDLLLRLYQYGYQGVNLAQTWFDYSLPNKGTTNRTFHMRVNEMKTRYIRYKSLNLLPEALPYVLKPIAVGMLPKKVLEIIKQKKYRSY